MIAELLREVCSDIGVEPRMQPLEGEWLPPSANKSDEARLDVRAKGFWDNQMDAFFMYWFSTLLRPVIAILDWHQFTVNMNKRNVWSMASG